MLFEKSSLPSGSNSYKDEVLSSLPFTSISKLVTLGTSKLLKSKISRAKFKSLLFSKSKLSTYASLFSLEILSLEVLPTFKPLKSFPHSLL